METYINEYITALWELTVEMAPYLLLGFLIAGILHVFFPTGMVNRFMGKRSLKSVTNAALFGIPLPLCSCGVIPTGMSFYKNGASKGSTNSFLISTPQTGVDSILVTYSMLGLPMAVIRPIIAFISGIFGGLLTNTFDKIPNESADTEVQGDQTGKGPAIKRMLHYAFVTFLQDIAQWLIIGLLLAALMAVLIPDDFFVRYINNEYWSMAIVLAASVPLYVCATGSVPIAAVLLAKGLSPGAAIVFLMAGPATNAATMTVIGNVMGRKALITYMISIIAGAIIFGIVVNEWLPRAWFTDHVMAMGGGAHEHSLLPSWMGIGSAILLIILIFNGYRIRYKNVVKKLMGKGDETAPQPNSDIMQNTTVKVNGMTCNHCKANVEKNLAALEGIKSINVDLATSRVTISGEEIDLDKVKSTVEDIGYEYAGEEA